MNPSSNENERDLTKGGREPHGGEIHVARPTFRSAPTLNSAEPMRLGSFTGSPSSTKSHVAPLEQKKRWFVNEAPPKPIFPLERPVEVEDNPRQITARIDDSLRLRSVDVEFNGSQAMCKTSDFLTYSIDLYAVTEDKTLVEVMRHQGCGFAFRKEREAVINAARGFGGKPTSKLPKIMKIPQDLLKEYKPPTEQDHEDTLFRATDQLHSNQRDVQLFTLQNLSSITTPDKVCKASVQMMSRLIMENRSDIRSMIAAVLNACVSENDYPSVEILNSCLTIFDNSMSALSQEGIENKDSTGLQGVLKTNGKGFADSMVPTLLGIVKDCKCPHNACLALRCLCLLLKNSPDACNRVTEEARLVIEHAESFGRQRHSNLEVAARDTLVALQGK